MAAQSMSYQATCISNPLRASSTLLDYRLKLMREGFRIVDINILGAERGEGS